MAKWKRVGSIALVLVVAALARGIARDVVREWLGTSARQQPLASYTALAKMADQVNRSLPMMVDRDTQLMSTVGLDGVFVYNYRLVNYQFEDVDPAVLTHDARPNLLNGACTKMAPVIKRGVTLRYSYSDQANRFIASVDVKPADCGF